MTAPVPVGVRIVADADTTSLDPATLLGGAPRRVMRLSPAGQAAWDELVAGPVTSPAAGVLARRLTDAGLAHPQPGPATSTVDVTIVIPVRDRAALLDACLRAIGQSWPVVVVDDGSINPHAVADVVARHGATLVSSAVNAGPAAARNRGLQQVSSEFVAFLDSDCTPSPEWIERLAAHFVDPLVGAVAPRIVASDSGSSYLSRCSGLDLGPRAARVRPGSRVSYVPTAALLVRRAALAAAAVGTDGAFDPSLRYGEDVDLVWRLDSAGWRVRYDPSAVVSHREPQRWLDRVRRHFHYGTSAAPLSARHPHALAPVALHPWPSVAVAGLLTRRPSLAVAGLLGSTVATRRALGRAGVESAGVTRTVAASITATGLGVGRYATQFAVPALAAALVAPGDRSRSRRLAAATLLVAPPIASWLSRRPAVSPARFVAGQIVDDVAYGTGVYAGCIRGRTLTPLRPTIARSARTSRGDH